jgi:cell wall-associated NlpC family hydrolase
LLSNPTGRSAELTTSHSDSPAPTTRSQRKPRLLHMLVMGVAVPGIFCTVALPAYAMTTNEGAEGAAATAALQSFREEAAQSVAVDETVVQNAGRDSYTAVSAAEMRAAEIAAQRAAAAAAMASQSRYGGPSVRSLLANPPYPNFSLDTIVSIAMQYQGVPYRYGGADPSGFDCSGFTQFVYAHVGVSLPHSSSAQGAMTRIAPEAALPGDLVILDGGGHVGIYLGNGQMIDAPYAGKTVQPRAIYSSNHWFVRVGI